MKVMTLSTRFGLGGAELNSLLLCEQLKKRHCWSIIPCFLMYANGHVNSQDSVIIHKEETRNPFMIFAIFIRLLILVLREKPDVIIGFQPLANIFGSVVSIFSSAKFIGTQRNPAFSQSRVIAFIEKTLGSTKLYKANIAVSNSVVESYSNYPRKYKEKLKVVHNGFENRPAKNNKTHSRISLGIPLEVNVIGFIGRLAYQKYPEFLIEVLKKIKDKNTILVYAGNGECLQGLKVIAAEEGLEARVLFLDALRYEAIFEFYDAIDIFLLPSRFEGFGRTVVEAMQSSLPVLATKLNVTIEVLGTSEYLFDHVPESWACAIDSLLTSPSEYKIVSGMNVKRAEFFSIDAMIDGYKNIMDEVLTL